MNCDENNLLHEDLTPDDVSAKSKPDDAENNQRSRKRKTISRKNIQKTNVGTVAQSAPTAAQSAPTAAQSAPTAAQSAPTAAQSAPTAAQSAPTAAQSAPSAAQSAQFAAHVATPWTSFQNVPISAALSSDVVNTSPYGAVFSPDSNTVISLGSVDTGFNPVYADPDFAMANVKIQPKTVALVDEDIPQISYEGDEPKGPDISPSLASYVEGCTGKKIKKEDLDPFRQRFPLPGNCQFLQVPSMDKDVWRCMSRDQKHSDISLQAAQAKIAKAMTATIRAKELLNAQKQSPMSIHEFMSNINQLLMNVIPFLGNAFLDVHNSRRYAIKSRISEGYWAIVQPGPLNGKVFGGKVADAVKEMTEGAK
eukprot:gene10276-18973_t